MQLADRQYEIGQTLCQRAGASTPFDWKFQEKVVFSDTNQDKVLKDSSFFSPLSVFLFPIKKPRKGNKRQ